MQEENKTWFYILNSILIVAIIFVVIVIAWFNSDLNGKGFEHKEYKISEATEGWVSVEPDGSYVDFTDFNKPLDRKTITLSRIFIFEREDFYMDTLSFFANYCIVEVFQDGFLVYSSGTEKDLEGRILPGLYNVTAVLDVLPGEASEVTVKLSSFKNLTVDPFYFGNGYDLAERDFRSSMPGIVFAVLSLILILMIMFVVAIGLRSYSIPVSYNYFLMFILIATIWVTANIKNLAYSGFHPGLMNLIANEAFLAFPLFYGLFLHNYFEKKSPVTMFITVVSFLNIIVINILAVARAVYIIDTFHVTVVLCAACLVSSLVQSVLELMKGKITIRVYAMFIGSIILIFGGGAQLVDIAQGNTNNISFWMLGSLVLFEIVHSVAFIFYLMNLVSEGRKAGDYLVMAKTDTLTGLGNRRGLESYISEISQRSTPFFRVGCIVCDLNGLKKTNDTYGHDVGDQMLKDFANCLKECFDNRGVPFRSGGDEFYILFSDVEVDMGAMMRRLVIGIDGTNTRSEYKLSCSSGCYADYVPSKNETAVWDIIKLADAEMYKQKMKDRARAASARE